VAGRPDGCGRRAAQCVHRWCHRSCLHPAERVETASGRRARSRERSLGALPPRSRAPHEPRQASLESRGSIDAGALRGYDPVAPRPGAALQPPQQLPAAAAAAQQAAAHQAAVAAAVQQQQQQQQAQQQQAAHQQAHAQAQAQHQQQQQAHAQAQQAQVQAQQQAAVAQMQAQAQAQQQQRRAGSLTLMPMGGGAPWPRAALGSRRAWLGAGVGLG